MPRTHQSIRIDKSLHLWIIIPAAQIIQLRFRIVVISTIANGGDLGHGAAAGNNIAPGIVYVAGGGGTGSIDQSNYIALKVQHVDILGSVIDAAGGVALVIVDDIQGMAAPGLPNYFAVLGQIIVDRAANGFTVPDSGYIVGVGNGGAAGFSSGSSSPVKPDYCRAWLWNRKLV